MFRRPAGRDVLGERDRVVGVVAVGRDRRRVDQPPGPLGGHRRLEYVAGAGQVDPRALLARSHDDERQMDHHIGVGDQVVDRLPVQDVALPIGGLGPPERGRVEQGGAPIPTIRSTAGFCSSAVTAEMPISPVGPVTRPR